MEILEEGIVFVDDFRQRAKPKGLQLIFAAICRTYLPD